MWQMIAVVPVVLVATLYVAWTLLPAGLRRRLAGRLVAWARRQGRPAWFARAAGVVERLARAHPEACGDCSVVGTSRPSSTSLSRRPDRAGR